MFSLDTYMTEELLSAALNAFEWPSAFELEDEMPEGINIVFSKSNIFFAEGEEGHISAEFLPENTQEPGMRITIQDALEILAPEVDTRGYDFFHIPGRGSEEKVKAGIEKCCKLIHAHLLPVVEGDFSWVPAAKAKRFPAKEE